jgi:hypothetical protein
MSFIRFALIAMVFAASSATYGQALRGVFDCAGYGCLLDIPTPELETQAFIANQVNSSVEQWKLGDTVVVCNETHCDTYTMTNPYVGIASMVGSAKVPRGNFLGGSGGGFFDYGGGGGGGLYGPGPSLICTTYVVRTCSNQGGTFHGCRYDEYTDCNF